MDRAVRLTLIPSLVRLPPARTAASSSVSSRDRVSPDVVFGDVFAQRFARNSGPIQVQQTRTTAVDAAQDSVYSPGVVAVFDVIIAAGRHFADVRRAAAELVDPLDVVFHAGFAGDRQDVEHGIGASAHGHVQDHGVVERLGGANFPGQQAVPLAFFIIF